MVAQLFMQPIERAVIPPLAEVRPGYALKVQIMRDAVPVAAGAQDTQQPVSDLSHITE